MQAKQSWFYWRDASLYLHIYLQPRASKNRVIGIHDDCLKISLTTAPVEGQANQHLIKFIAEIFDVPKKNVRIEHGESSRKKWLRITGVKGDENTPDPVSFLHFI